MLTIVIQVDAPPGQAIGVKEHLAMCLERYGDTRVVEIRETGAEQMSTLEKIIFLADYIEVNRDFDGVDDLRQAARRDLDEAVLLGYDSTIRHLLDQGKPIFVGTVVNRNAQIDVVRAADGKA